MAYSAKYFELPRVVSAIIGGLPFALAEAKGLTSPYEKRARDVMFDSDDSK
jgi:hypothetical protein